jgi:predicted kinase
MRAIVIIGVQGTGKSTYCKKLEAENPKMKRVTKDDIRFAMFDLHNYNGETYDRLHEEYGETLEKIYWMYVDTILKQGLTVILDETHHKKKDRKATLKKLKDTYPGIKVEAHFLYSSFERCWARNIKRRPEQIVPREVMRRYLEELVASFAGSLSKWKVSAKLAWEFFDTSEYIYADEFLDN